MRRVVEHFGHIDILVNNARAIIGRDEFPITELREDVWQHFLAINTTAVFLCTKFVGQEMLRQGRGGRIINIASNAAKQASATGAASSASKFAVLGLTQAAALDLAPYGITVNAVCPGPVNTDRLSYWGAPQQPRAYTGSVSCQDSAGGWARYASGENRRARRRCQYGRLFGL